jgi:two-component system LytT family response regulator
MKSEQDRIRTVTVDDEPLARDAIRLRLHDEPDIEMVGEAGTGREAVALIGEALPNLVFLDVQMPGMDGFEVLDRVASTWLPIVVFVTAHDRYAIKAFETHALDYVLKPFTAIASRRPCSARGRPSRTPAIHSRIAGSSSC